MTERNFTCIICPLGCSLKVVLENGAVQSVTGNTCPRGKAYAEEECLAPKRTLTTTVRCENGALLPVRTVPAIPKEKLFEAMKIINKVSPPLPISVGDVIIEDIFGSKLVAAANLKE